ncbi:aminoglycoside N(3)-acetyltransferase [Salipaludibacillus daqingensis]|uniref:aminoglycoside N(3)-acetyltransferase n=1 Tax=Salipaludibacillus daqingensis TaxID=3041001 RepID=UPI002475F851|nr:AAC(3) family N-acetyltransferase [Salipaludibacillus daqingensis]
MKKIINQTKELNTQETLEKELKQLGLQKGMTVLVHSSLSSLGWTSGGAVAVIHALMNVVTEEGTVVMPTHSGDLSDPEEWEDPPVPKEWWETIRMTMPPYDPNTTPTFRMGHIPELFRTFPEVVRSEHPALSFAAWGRYKQEIVANHKLDFGLGETSPLARLYKKKAFVLFIGTSYDSNTCFHLGEYRARNNIIEDRGAPMKENGDRVWKNYRDILFSDDQFEQIGDLFEKYYIVETGKIGQATCRLFKLNEAVDFATKTIKEDRKRSR